MHVFLVSCAKSKRAEASAAKDLYTSAAFANRRRIAENEGDRWFILSGLYGLVDPDRVVEPYEMDLNGAGRIEREAWSKRVTAQVAEHLGSDLSDAKFEVLAGAAYCSHGLIDGLVALGAQVDWPVRGMRQGEQGAYFVSRASGLAGEAPKGRQRSPSSHTYRLVSDALLQVGTDSISMTFQELENLTGRSLPPSARVHRAWWSGTESKKWKAEDLSLWAVDQQNERVTFGRGTPSSITTRFVEEKRREIDDELVSEAVRVLSDSNEAECASSFPSKGQRVHLPGLYSWWADQAAREAIGAVLQTELPALIYAGQAGAGTAADLKQRILSTHIGGQITRSTFRLTLASVLRDELNLELLAPEKLSDESEQALTRWIKQHLLVAVFPYADRSTLRTFEADVIKRLDAPLNLSKMHKGNVRRRLSALRSEIRRDP
jgi:hypothetical protein